jgi:CxxC motif-containing protein (DUF1111 family)
LASWLPSGGLGWNEDQDVNKSRTVSVPGFHIVSDRIRQRPRRGVRIAGCILCGLACIALAEEGHGKAGKTGSGKRARRSAAAALVGPPIVPQPKMGEPLLGLTPEQLTRFFIGRAAYDHNLEVGEGLGPVFNENSCSSCHNNPLGGPGSQMVTRFGLNDDKNGFDPLANLGGSLLQAQAIGPECAEEVPAEANVMTNRVTNGMMGYGLVEAIPDADLLANESSPPGGVSGIAHLVEAFEDPPNSPLRVGRFGWKAQVATILTFSGDASLNEMGLTNRFVGQENDPNGVNPPSLGAPDFCDTVADPEDSVALGDGVTREFIDVVTDFQRFLAAPPQTPRSGMSGEAIFNAIGCANCHVPAYTTSNDAGLEDAIRGKAIRPYSDFLLHDMGLLGDNIVQGQGTEREMKTPPLWGLLRRDPLLHDGRVAGGTLADRIMGPMGVVFWHDQFLSEARPSAQAFNALSAGDKALVIAFLGSLGRAEFDANGDNDRDVIDFLYFMDCLGAAFTPDDPCAVHDIDQDGDVDGIDFNYFLQVYEGPRHDCNCNGLLDLQDIYNGAADTDADGVPDKCGTPCPADSDCSGQVDVTDLLTLLAAWGMPGTFIDLDNSGFVDAGDLLALLASWGACP